MKRKAIKRRRETARRGPVVDRGHRADLKLVGSCWVREMVPGATACSSRVIETDHSGYKGIGQKCDDDECADICPGHHRERTDHYGTFAEMPIETEREYRDRAIQRARERVARWRSPAIPF